MVTVYTKDNCQPCKITKREFDRLGIQYTEINIDSNPDALSAVMEMGFMAAPVVVPENGEAWSGLNPSKIKSLV